MTGRDTVSDWDKNGTDKPVNRATINPCKWILECSFASGIKLCNMHHILTHSFHGWDYNHISGLILLTIQLWETKESEWLIWRKVCWMNRWNINWLCSSQRASVQTLLSWHFRQWFDLHIPLLQCAWVLIRNQVSKLLCDILPGVLSGSIWPTYFTYQWTQSASPSFDLALYYQCKSWFNQVCNQIWNINCQWLSLSY